MSECTSKPVQVTATVLEVLPSTGLAYVTDEHDTCWAVTRSTSGVGLDRLAPGQRLALTLVHHGDFSVVSAYAPLD